VTTRDDIGVVTAGSGKEQMDWLRPRLARSSNRWAHWVDELLPSGYDSYLRLFHPFVPWDSEIAEPVPRDRLRSWETLAAENGIVFHGELQWNSLKSVVPILSDGGRRYATFEGQIERSTANTMMSVLATSGPSQHVFFIYSHVGLMTPNDEPVAYLGEPQDFDAVIEVAGLPGPTCIWPEDRRWLVATDFDMPSTYIACDASTSDALMIESGLETVAVSLNTRIDQGSDQLNGTGYSKDYKPRSKWWRG